MLRGNEVRVPVSGVRWIRRQWLLPTASVGRRVSVSNGNAAGTASTGCNGLLRGAGAEIVKMSLYAMEWQMEQKRRQRSAPVELR
jgi:hypothetical protein